MLISCPNCNSVYNISDTRIPLNGKKFKCAECGRIWRVLPQDVQSLEPESKNIGVYTAGSAQNKNDDINIMFSRLSHNTKNLFAGDNINNSMTAADKLRRFCRNFFSRYLIIAFLLVLSIILAGFLAYRERYEIVSRIPGMEKVYTRFNVDCVYSGRGIVFEGVNIRDLQRQKNTIEISGRLLNSSNMTVNTLPVKASFIDNDGNVESEIIELLPPQRITPKANTLFRIVADAPSPAVSKVRLSLEDITQD